MKSNEIIKNLREKKLVDLIKEVSIESEKLAHFQMEVAAKKLKDYSKIRKQRKIVARAYTIINEKLEASDGK